MEGYYNTPRYLLRRRLIACLLRKYHLQGCASLELGYGGGDLLMFCAKHGLHPDGFDISEDAQAVAQKCLQQAGIDNVRLLRDISEIQVNTYDILFACEVLEHIEDPASELSAWRRFLKENGLLILSVPAHMKRWNSSDIWAGHVQRFEKRALVELLSNTGFTVQSVWSYPFPANLLLDPLLVRSTRALLEQGNTTQYSRKNATQQSGIVRRSNSLMRFLSNPVLIEPIHWLQVLFLHTDLGSGYVVCARKNG